VPLYEYKCDDCDSGFALKRSVDACHSDVNCPQCRGKVRRVFSAVPIIFRGSGFYITDSKNSQQ